MYVLCVDIFPEPAEVATMAGALTLVPCAHVCECVCMYVLCVDTSPEPAEVATMAGALNLVPVRMCVYLCA